MPDIEKVRGHLRGIQHRMLDPEPLDDVDRTDIHLRMALTLTLLTNMEAEIKRLKAEKVTLDGMTILRVERHLEAFPDFADESAATCDLIFHGSQRMWEQARAKEKEAARG